MKAVNDYRILMPNVPYYATGLQFNEFAVVYYTGINVGNYSYTGPQGSFADSVAQPFRTGYYYAKRTLNSGENLFFSRPDATVTGPNPNPWTQDFFFVPCYGSSVSFRSNYYENVFQDNYKTILGKSENTVQVSASLDFKNISDDEFKALNHFYQRYYTESSLSDGQGKTTVSMPLFYPHLRSRPYYVKSIQNNYENIDCNNVTLSLETPFVCSTEWKSKLIPFLSADEFQDGKMYDQHSYVFLRNAGNANGFYYFSGEEPARSSPLSSTGGWTQKFYFKPDLVEDLNFESKVHKNDLGNFYLYQDVGLNPNFFDFSIVFSNRSDKEARAILQFLESHNGIDLFEYDGHSFFTGTRNFYCPEWNHTYNFFDNHTISARLVELKITDDKVSSFDTEILNNGVNFGFLPAGFFLDKAAYVKNNERKYPTTYTIYDPIEESAYATNFVSLNQQTRELQVKAGSSGEYSIRYKIPQNFDSSLTLTPRGYFPVAQENEIIGSEGSTLALNYSGVRVNNGGAAPYNFLSGVQNCVVSPVYSNDSLGALVRWTVPFSGYFATGYLARISSNSGFTTYTGSTVEVPLNSSNYLYEIGTPGETTFSTVFTGLSVNSPYYVSVSGINGNYTSHTGKLVYASGVSDAETWPNPAYDYAAVQSGLTQEVLSSISGVVPNFTISKTIKTKTISNASLEYFDLYDYASKELSYRSGRNYYSGITITFDNSKIGPRTADSSYGIYDSGVFIVTGDFSSLTTGVTINLINGSLIYGKGGSTSLNSTQRNGSNAVYINCSGTMNFALDDTSYVVGGGGAGDNVRFSDVADVAGGKFATLKESFRNSAFCTSGVKNVTSNVFYNTSDTEKIYSAYNNQNLQINSSTASSVGSSIFYDFFMSNSLVDEDTVLGAPGVPFGAGSGTAYFASTSDSDLVNRADSFNLINLLLPGKDFYKQ